jgi:hypothetical protein
VNELEELIRHYPWPLATLFLWRVAMTVVVLYTYYHVLEVCKYLAWWKRNFARENGAT